MLIFVNDFLLRLRVHSSVCQSNMNTHHITLTSCSFSTHENQMNSQYTLGSHLIGCKFQACLSVFICSSLSMTSFCVSYTVLFVNLIWILTIYFDFLFIFDTWSNEFSIHTRSHLIVCKFQVCVFVFLYAHLCQWLPPRLPIRCSVCQDTWYEYSPYYFDFLFIFDTWKSNEFSIHTRFTSHRV